jgi:hypothetical protein
MLNTNLMANETPVFISPVSPRSRLPLANEIEVQEEIKFDHRRSEMKKFLIVAGLLTVIATPAFAQAFDPSSGSGNVLPYHWTGSGRLVRDFAPQQVAPTNGGGNAFAMAPEKSVEKNAITDPDSPANTGGGSEGYNWNLSHIQP